jgi:cysteine-rich repeat protein
MAAARRPWYAALAQNDAGTQIAESAGERRQLRFDRSLARRATTHAHESQARSERWVEDMGEANPIACALRRAGVALLLFVIACSDGAVHSAADGGEDGPALSRIEQPISPDAGGTVSLPDGPTVAIPAGALPSGNDVSITIGLSTLEPPPGAVTPVWAFGPEGTHFDALITVALPFDLGGGDASEYTIAWTKRDEPAVFEDVPTTFAVGRAIALIDHFSSGCVRKKPAAVSCEDAQASARDTDDDGVPDTCACNTGYMDLDGACVDVNECESDDTCGPGVRCTNTPGGFECSGCRTGYVASESGCMDVNECSLDNGGCDADATCTNLDGAFRCGDCPVGYAGGGARGCIDIDECRTNNGGCDQHVKCTNVPGGHRCGGCPDGYEDAGDGSCRDIDECQTDNGGCDPHTKCTNVPGGRTCGDCPGGFTGSGTFACIDVDECALNHGGCDPLAPCINTPGGVSCGACPRGFTGTGASECVDIDECADNNGGCDPLTKCTNTGGGYACGLCPLGYSGTGKTGCTDIDECKKDSGGCAGNVSCHNTPGGHTCGSCEQGFVGGGAKGCVDVDECAADNGSCDRLTSCSNTQGSRMCGACPPGYSGDGAGGCIDINECADGDNGGCDIRTSCTNKPGSRSCGVCPSGFVGTGDGECRPAPDSARDITRFQIGEWRGTITANAVSITVPHATDVRALTPDIIASGKSIAPASGETRDFSQPVTYTVTARDGSTKSYRVEVLVAAESAKEILSFSIDDVPANIAGSEITITVPYGSDLSMLAPVIGSSGASVSPASGQLNDFSSPQRYTVTAADGSTQAYSVTVKVAAAASKDITCFRVLGLDADIDANAISLIVPPDADITALTPALAISGASVKPASGDARDFTYPVTYTVTAANGGSKAYTVTISRAKSAAKNITSFRVLGVSADIIDDRIALTLPYATDLRALRPSIGIDGAGISPSSDTPQDFTQPVTYTVIGSDGGTREYRATVRAALGNAKQISAFSIQGVAGAIDHEHDSIALMLPFGSSRSALTPTIVHTGAGISPASLVEQDFTKPVVYTVTAADGGKAQYTVSVAVAPNTAKDITRFSVAGRDATIQGTQLELELPYGTALDALAPQYTSSGVTVTPASGVPQDFSDDVQYTVTAADGSTQVYTAHVSVAPSPPDACGDGVLERGEQCDDGNRVDDDTCSNRCLLSLLCGNGVKQGSEECDDGDHDDTNACLSTCQIARCGDGKVRQGVEQCDDGNGDDSDACLSNCRAARCGDGVVRAGVEECDDGNQVDDDACSNGCLVALSCGDAVQQTGEPCDDGNQSDYDACLTSCQSARCGDGVVQSGVEECDDGNAADDDACLTSCKRARCGDGVVERGIEACDDGNRVDDDVCSNGCKLAASCGNGMKDGVEECDDGNQNDTDACLHTCQAAYCGDGVVQAGVEECDDGNDADADGCSGGCNLE